MNEQQYKEARKTGTIKVIEIPVDSINPLAAVAQVRKSGTQTDHLNAIISSMEQLGQQVPITVEACLGASTYTLVAGNHRWNGAKTLGWKTIKAVVKQFTGADDRLLYQIEENEHLPALNNCQATQENSLSELITVHRYFDVNGRLPTQEEVYEKVRALKIYPNLHWKTLRKIVKSIYKSKAGLHTTGKYAGYEKQTTAFAMFKSLYVDNAGVPKWNGDHISEVVDNISVFFVGADQDAKNAIMNSLYAKLKNPQYVTVACIWVNQLFGKDDAAIDKHRDLLYKKIKDANNAWFVDQGFSFMDEIYFLPQKKSEVTGSKLLLPKDIIAGEKVIVRKSNGAAPSTEVQA